MSYLAFDLDALKRVPDAARSAGIPEAELGYGLIRLWQWCWTEKTDRVEPTHLRGFFGGDTARVADSLAAFKFIELDDEHWFRVRGVERYLRVQKSRSEGGKTASGNLRKGHGKAEATNTLQPEVVSGSSSGSPPAHLRLQPESSSGSLPALTPSTEHRAPNALNTLRAEPAEPKKKRASEPPKPADPRHAPLVLELVTIFEAVGFGKYDFSGHDAKLVTALLDKGDPAEVGARWRRALRHEFPTMRTLFDLNKHWNKLSVDPPTNGKSQTDWRLHQNYDESMS